MISRREVPWSARLSRELDRDLYVRPRAGLEHGLHQLDQVLYDAPAPGAEVLLAPEIWGHWVRWVRQRQKDHLDTVIVLSGRKGRGKSTLGFRLARALDPRFTLNQVVYRAADMADLFVNLRVEQAAMYDEAALGLLSTDWASIEARELVHSVTILRPKRLTLILCLPRFKRLNAAFREDLVDLWVRIDSRGTGIVHPAEDKERYTDRRGLGWFPDPEWNPLSFESLQGDPMWHEFERHRWAQSVAFLKRAAQRIGSHGGTADQRVGAERRFPCPVCKIDFDRRDALHRHFTTKKHLEKEGKRPSRGPAPGSSGPTNPPPADTDTPSPPSS